MYKQYSIIYCISNLLPYVDVSMLLLTTTPKPRLGAAFWRFFIQNYKNKIDQKLAKHIQNHGHGSWRALPKLAGSYIYISPLICTTKDVCH